MTELFFAAFVQAVNLGNVILIVWALPEETLASLKEKLDRFLGKALEGGQNKISNVDHFVMLASVWVTTLAIVLSVLSYERHPHIPDEVVHLYQARYFAKGMLTMPAPPVPDAFALNLMTYEENRWYSPVPPGWPAMLTLGVKFGVPWLINPMLAGLSMVLIFIFIQEIYDLRTARMVLLLLCFSPWYVFMAMNFMAHTFCLTCAMSAAIAIAWAKKTGKAMWGWMGGCFIGMVSLIRPLEGVIVAGLLGLWAIGLGGRRLKISGIAFLLLGTLIVGSAGLYYNNLLTGHPSRFPLMAYFDKYYGPGVNDLGFGPNRGLNWAIDPFPGHSPLDALINAILNIFSLNVELFGWSAGSLILVAIMLFSGRMRRSDYLMLTVIIAVIGVHSFYWFSGGPDFGARYWYLVIVPCIVLTVRAIRFLAEQFESVSVSGTMVMTGVLSICLLALLNFFSRRGIDKYHHYRGMRPDVHYLAEKYSFGRSLVLIRGNQNQDYASAATYNPVDLQAPVPIYAWDRNPETRAKVLRFFQDRQIWIINGPSITHGGYRVVGRPYSAGEMLSGDN